MILELRDFIAALAIIIAVGGMWIRMEGRMSRLEAQMDEVKRYLCRPHLARRARASKQRRS